MLNDCTCTPEIGLNGFKIKMPFGKKKAAPVAKQQVPQYADPPAESPPKAEPVPASPSAVANFAAPEVVPAFSFVKSPAFLVTAGIGAAALLWFLTRKRKK